VFNDIAEKKHVLEWIYNAMAVRTALTPESFCFLFWISQKEYICEEAMN